MDKCEWCKINEKMELYHDTEWGVPLFDDDMQFEFISLEVMQCGLNWNMMLQKREIFRRCFDGFDYKKVAAYEGADVERILSAPGMIKSSGKIRAIIQNAKTFSDIAKEYGSFSTYIWGLAGNKIHIYPDHEKILPAKNALSEYISRELKKRGMKYMGAITVYSHLQACGIINDHTKDCFRHDEVMRGHDIIISDDNSI